MLEVKIILRQVKVWFISSVRLIACGERIYSFVFVFDSVKKQEVSNFDFLQAFDFFFLQRLIFGAAFFCCVFKVLRLLVFALERLQFCTPFMIVSLSEGAELLIVRRNIKVISEILNY